MPTKSIDCKRLTRHRTSLRVFLRHRPWDTLSQRRQDFPGRTINIGSSRSCRTGLMVFPKIRSFSPPCPCAPMMTRSGRISRAYRTISRLGEDECEIAVSTAIPCARKRLRDSLQVLLARLRLPPSRLLTVNLAGHAFLHVQQEERCAVQFRHGGGVADGQPVEVRYGRAAPGSGDRPAAPSRSRPVRQDDRTPGRAGRCSDRRLDDNPQQQQRQQPDARAGPSIASTSGRQRPGDLQPVRRWPPSPAAYSGP